MAPAAPPAAGAEVEPAAVPAGEASTLEPADLSLADLVQEPAPEKKEETFPSYKANVTGGAFWSAGNTDKRSMNLNSTYERRFDKENRVTTLFDFIYSEEKDPSTKVWSRSARRVRGAAQYDHFFEEKLYGFGRADAQGDHQQKLTLRGIASAGVGYQMIDTKESKLALEGGLAWTYEDFKAASPEDYWGLRLAGKYFRQITEQLLFNTSLDWLPSLEDKDDVIVFFMAQLDYSFTKSFLTTLRYEMDYDNTPAAGAERTDHRVIWGLGWSF
jgi:putative salt-induced outer membrane protein YdiY